MLSQSRPDLDAAMGSGHDDARSPSGERSAADDCEGGRGSEPGWLNDFIERGDAANSAASDFDDGGVIGDPTVIGDLPHGEDGPSAGAGPGGLANSQAPAGELAHSQAAADKTGGGAMPAPSRTQSRKQPRGPDLPQQCEDGTPSRKQPRVPDSSQQSLPAGPPQPANLNATAELLTMTPAEFKARFVTACSGKSSFDGSYGRVSAYLDTRLDVLVAVKTFRQRVSIDDRKREVEQAVLWRALPHENLVRFLGVVAHKGKPVSIIFPHARESLADRFDAFCGMFTLPDIGVLMGQLAAALNHMHKHGVIHRDVKPANILLHSSLVSPMRLVLCDYGLARTVHLAETPRMQTQPYRAPEMELGRPPTTAVDTWSVGCIFREMLTGVLLWEKPEYSRLSALEYMVLIAVPVTKEELLQMSYPSADIERMARIQPLPWTAGSIHSSRPPEACRSLAQELLTWSPGARKNLVEARASFQHLGSARRRLVGKAPPLTPYEGCAKARDEVCPVAAQAATPSTTASGSIDGLADSRSIAADSAAKGASTAAAPAGPSTEPSAGSMAIVKAQLTPTGKGRPCRCVSWHCKNSEEQHVSQPRGLDGSSRKRHERLPCSRLVFDGSHYYCSLCRCHSNGCYNVQYSCDMCVTHWHESAVFAPEWGVAVDLADIILAKMEPPDLQMFLSLSWSVPLPALVIASQMWEPAPVRIFCEEVKKVAEGPRSWRTKGAKILMTAFRKAVAHSHCLLQSDDADHRRCLEILAFGGVARHFGTLALGRRLGCIIAAAAKSAAGQTFRLGLERTSVVFQPCSDSFQDLVDKLPYRLSKPQDCSQFSAWIAKLDQDLKSLGPWACHGDTVQKSKSSPSYKRMHSVRKLFTLMAVRHPDDFGDLRTPSGWKNWTLPTGQTSLGVLMQLSPDEKGYLQSLPCFGQNWTFLRRVGDPLRATMLTCLIGQALNDEVAAKSRDGVRVRAAVLRWRADGTLRERFEQAFENLAARHKHSHVYHVFREAVRAEDEKQKSQG